MKITLIGYMGSGKTTVGKILSTKLDLPFIDLDHYISDKEGQSISNIFKQKGEIYFRKKEKEYLTELLATDNLILATGGGTPVFYNNMNCINDNSTSIFLQGSPTKLASHLENGKSQRPLIHHLEDDELIEFVAKHLFERNRFYQMSQHRIPIGNKSPNDIADEIIEKL